MNDPHVVWLKYKLHTHSSISFASPPEIIYEMPSFRALLSNDLLTVEVKDHFVYSEASPSYIVNNEVLFLQLNIKKIEIIIEMEYNVSFVQIEGKVL
jgi:hypothetical protein